MTADTTARNRAIAARYEAGASISTLKHEHNLAPATITKIIGREQLRQLHAGQRLTQMAYDGLVERWNDLTRIERQAAAAECKREGHTYRETPGRIALVCVHCLNYVTTERNPA